MILASRQTYRWMGQNWEYKNKPIHLWSIDFQQGYQDHSMWKNSLLHQQRCSSWVSKHRRIKSGPLPYTICVFQSLSCVQLWDPMDCSSPGSSVPGICQARILEWAAISSSRESSQPRDWIESSSPPFTDGFFTPEPPGKPSLYTIFSKLTQSGSKM